MNRFYKSVLIAIGGMMIAAAGSAEVVLDGRTATSAKIAAVASGAKVRISPSALEKVKASHRVLLEAAKAGHKIYGLTVGVGLNKDQKMVDAKGELSPEVIRASQRFNKGLIHAHCGGVGQDMPIKTARAVLATRLNNMLFGGTGVQEHVVYLYRDFLNRDLIPVMPSIGSVGQADITILGHVGLAMMGEGDVFYQGIKMSASDAMAQAGLKRLVPWGKDSLSILSSNAYSAGLGALALEEMKQLAAVQKVVYALSLEALNGNVAPLLEETTRLRPFPGFKRAAADIRDILQDSYLWDQNKDRALQDPLSYRDSAYILGTLDSSVTRLNTLLTIQFNSSDDNPGVATGVSSTSQRFQEKKLYVKGGNAKGAVVPTANFEPLPWVIAFETAGISIGHNSLTSAQRTIKLAQPQFTKLTRFLGTDQTVHAFGAMQKPFVALASENRELALPVSMDFMAMAGNIEDVATNAPRVVRRIRKQLDNLYHILGIEVIHAAQAIDLRLRKTPNLKLAPTTRKFFASFRKKVRFLEQDRPLTNDFRAAAAFLKTYPF